MEYQKFANHKKIHDCFDEYDYATKQAGLYWL